MNRGDILLVDDDPDLLKLISLRLTSAGYRVRTADSGETALATIAVERPVFRGPCALQASLQNAFRRMRSRYAPSGFKSLGLAVKS